jgi:subtilase family serine protease
MRPSPSCSFSIRQISGLAVTVFLSTGILAAQQPSTRILQDIDSSSVAALPGSVNPRIAAASDMGRLDPATPIGGVTIYFQPTADQQAQLDALVQAQQTPGSPYYHAWLTPAEYASRFGLSDADLAKVENWLQSQGFNVDRVSNSHTSIAFSGTAAQVESAFQTEMHSYLIGAETHFANATDLAIPAALSGVVRSIRNLNDFRPVPHYRPTPAFTSSQTGAHFLTPKDVATIYDINAAYNSGYTGSGQTIAVVGQSEIVASDIAAFQTAAGLTVKAPNIILMPGTGTAAISQGDEAESDLDLEYSGGTAPGATIDFVYVGNSQNYSVFDALQYAVDQKTAPIISISYGACENALTQSDYTTLEGIMEQGASQGQTVVAASGDTGSTACYDPTTKNPVTAAMEVLAVNYPASSAYAVGVGGTEFPAADVAASSTTYWKSASGSDLVNSALSYIPEQAWNDDSASIGQQYGALYALSSGGGGVSTFTARPTWQTGVTGIASGSFRLVPDVSLASSPENAPYLFCTGDTSAWNSGQKASCNSGFRDSTTQDLTAAGGTSFATPIFAGMLAIIGQKENSTGFGVADKTIYSLAANSTTYASAFHDITSGGNQCTAGSTYCSTAGASEYPTTTGYDEATGLGSVDFNNLMTAWSGAGSGVGGGGGGGSGGTGTGSFTVSATNVAVAQGGSSTSTVTLTSIAPYAGTVGFALTSTSTSVNTYGCYTIKNAAVAAGASTTTTLTVYTSQTACSGVSGAHSFVRVATTPVAASHNNPPLGKTIPISAAALAGILFIGFRKSRKALSLLSCLALVAMLGFAAGCGSSSGSSTTSSSTGSTSTDVASGTYTLTLTGTDTTTSTINYTTTLTLTVN